MDGTARCKMMVKSTTRHRPKFESGAGCPKVPKSRHAFNVYRYVCTILMLFFWSACELGHASRVSPKSHPLFSTARQHTQLSSYLSCCNPPNSQLIHHGFRSDPTNGELHPPGGSREGQRDPCQGVFIFLCSTIVQIRGMEKRSHYCACEQ